MMHKIIIRKGSGTAEVGDLGEAAAPYGLNARDYLASVFAVSHSGEIPAEELEPLMPWNVKVEDLSIVTDEIDWLSRTMVPVQEWEECLATEGDKR